MNLKIVLLTVLMLSLSACASFGPQKGEKTIQKKCHSIIGTPDEFVCEKP